MYQQLFEENGTIAIPSGNLTVCELENGHL
jgi:hypothetical protein